MRLFTFAAPASVALVAFALVPSAQLAGEVAAVHRAGQTFVTWREAALSGVRYRVYRASAPLTSAADLALADLLGEVDDRSSHNQERSQVEHGERTWVLAAGEAPLAVDQGLFVYTVEADSPGAYYAVTSVRRGLENPLLTPGWNATLSALEEWCAPPEPVLQAQSTARQTWAHWVGNRDTPFQPALSLTPSHGFDFCLEPGSAPGPHGLVLRLHAAGGNYVAGWPARAQVPADVDVLALSDLHPTTGYTFWFGAHERFPLAPAPDTKVWDFTEERVLWTLDWMSAHLGDALEPARVSLIGSSLGAIGGMYLLECAPERFSAVLLRNGNYDLAAGDLDDISVFEKLYGPFALDLPTREGMPILSRTNARLMAGLEPAVDWPQIRTLNGRQDHRVGWASAVSLFHGLAENWRPAVHYFDERTHSPKGYWSTLERALIKRTCQARNDRPLPCFGACTLDDDAGDGTRDSGTSVGTLGGYADYDPSTALATPALVRFTVFLRAQNALDDARLATGLAELTPRRTGPFTLAPGELVHFTLTEGATLVDEQWLTADAHGLVHTAPIALTKLPRTALFEREVVEACQQAGLRLGVEGDELVARLEGRAGERAWLWLYLGDARAPRQALRTATAVCGSDGRAELRLAWPAGAPAASWLWARARLGAAWTPWCTASSPAGSSRR